MWLEWERQRNSYEFSVLKLARWQPFTWMTNSRTRRWCDFGCVPLGCGTMCSVCPVSFTTSTQKHNVVARSGTFLPQWQCKFLWSVSGKFSVRIRRDDYMQECSVVFFSHSRRVPVRRHDQFRVHLLKTSLSSLCAKWLAGDTVNQSKTPRTFTLSQWFYVGGIILWSRVQCTGFLDQIRLGSG
jgi:hypothetical protein